MELDSSHNRAHRADCAVYRAEEIRTVRSCLAILILIKYQNELCEQIC